MTYFFSVLFALNTQSSVKPITTNLRLEQRVALGIRHSTRLMLNATSVS